jgi:16S rRNA (cytidine1402-2'-O)-methyltransferase
MAVAFPGREAAIARELTKLFETVERAPIADLAARFAAAPPPKGEIVVLVGPGAADAADPAAVSAALRAALAHMTVRDAVDAVAAAHAGSRKALYALALQIKDEA